MSASPAREKPLNGSNATTSSPTQGQLRGVHALPATRAGELAGDLKEAVAWASPPPARRRGLEAAAPLEHGGFSEYRYGDSNQRTSRMGKRFVAWTSRVDGRLGSYGVT